MRKGPIGSFCMSAAILHRHDEVAETLARRPNAYLPIFMHDDGRVLIEDWTVGFMLGVGKRANAWSKSYFRTSVRPSRRSCRAIHWAATSCSMSRSPNSIGSRPPPTRRSAASYPRSIDIAPAIAPPAAA